MSTPEVTFEINEQTGELSVIIKNATDEEAKEIMKEINQAAKVTDCPFIFSEAVKT